MPQALLGVLLVDDQKLMLEALRVFIESAPDFEVLGEATDGRIAVSQARALRPDLILMDLQMPVLNGVEATAQILQEDPECKVVALTTFHSEEYVIPALKTGASGYLVKDSSPEEILTGIRAASEGEFVISPQVTDVLVRSVVEDNARVPARWPMPEDLGLSEREMEVVSLLCDGKSNREVAEGLHLAETTVKSHIARIMQKLGVRDRVQIVIAAYRSGLIEL